MDKVVLKDGVGAELQYVSLRGPWRGVPTGPGSCSLVPALSMSRSSLWTS